MFIFDRRDVITGVWKDTGELGLSALDLQLRLHEEAKLDAERRSCQATDVSLFEAAVAKVAGSIGDDLAGVWRVLGAATLPNPRHTIPYPGRCGDTFFFFQFIGLIFMTLLRR